MLVVFYSVSFRFKQSFITVIDEMKAGKTFDKRIITTSK